MLSDDISKFEQIREFHFIWLAPNDANFVSCITVSIIQLVPHCERDQRHLAIVAEGSNFGLVKRRRLRRFVYKPSRRCSLEGERQKRAPHFTCQQPISKQQAAI